MQGTISMGHLKRRIHSSLRTIMEIIIHNQCPLTLSAGLWINIVLMAEEKPAIPISQQLRPAQEQRQRRWQWVSLVALDVFVQPAQESPFYKPSATTIFQTHSLAACPGASCSSPQPFTASLPSERAKGAQSLQGTFPMGSAWYSSV